MRKYYYLSEIPIRRKDKKGYPDGDNPDDDNLIYIHNEGNPNYYPIEGASEYGDYYSRVFEGPNGHWYYQRKPTIDYPNGFYVNEKGEFVDESEAVPKQYNIPEVIVNRQHTGNNWLFDGHKYDLANYEEDRNVKLNDARTGYTSPFMRGVKYMGLPLHATMLTIPTLGFGALAGGAGAGVGNSEGLTLAANTGRSIWGNALGNMLKGMITGTTVNAVSQATTGKTFDEHSYNVLTNNLGVNPNIASVIAPFFNLGYGFGGQGINKLFGIKGTPKMFTPIPKYNGNIITGPLSSKYIPMSLRSNPTYRNIIGGLEARASANNRFGIFNQKPVNLVYKNLVDLSKPKPFTYDNEGNFVPNENYNFRNGWGITSDAIQTGRVRVPEGNYKAEVFKKYPFQIPKTSLSTHNENFKFPYFQKGEVIWPFDTGKMPEDLIAVADDVSGIRWPNVSRWGDIIEGEANVGNKTTPLVNGKTNQLPTRDTMFFKFNPETNRYEYYNNPNVFNFPTNSNHNITMGRPQAWGKYSPYYKHGMSTAVLTNPNGIKAINTPSASYFSAVNDYDNWLYDNGFTKNKVGISNNTNGVVIGEEPPWIEDAQRARAKAKGVDYDSAEMLTEEDISTPIRTNLTGKRVNSDFPSYNDRAIAADYINKYALDNYNYSLNLDADNLAHSIINNDNGFTTWIMRQGSYNDPRVKDIYNRINNSYLRDIRLVKKDPELAYSIQPQIAKKLGIKPYGVYNTKDPAKLYTKTHEADHVLLEPSEPIPQGVLEFPTISRNYFEQVNNTDVSTRLSQILNFHNIRDARKFTGLQLKHMFEDYLKAKQLDNSMTDLYKAVKDWDGLANWMNNPKNVLQLGIPISVGTKLLNNNK